MVSERKQYKCFVSQKLSENILMKRNSFVLLSEEVSEAFLKNLHKEDREFESVLVGPLLSNRVMATNNDEGNAAHPMKV